MYYYYYDSDKLFFFPSLITAWFFIFIEWKEEQTKKNENNFDQQKKRNCLPSAKTQSVQSKSSRRKKRPYFDTNKYKNMNETKKVSSIFFIIKQNQVQFAQTRERFHRWIQMHEREETEIKIQPNHSKNVLIH